MSSLTANATTALAFPLLPAQTSLTVSIYSPQLLTLSSTNAVTDVDPTASTLSASTVFSTDMDPSQESSSLNSISHYSPSFSPTNAVTMTWSTSIPGLNPNRSSTTTTTTSSISATSSSTSKTSSTGSIPTTYTAVMPTIFGAVIFVACIAVLRRYRRGRRTKTDEPSPISKAWGRLSTISPSSSHRTLGPENSLSQRHHSPQRGRSTTRDIAEARRSSLLRKARERFMARESTLVTKEVV